MLTVVFTICADYAITSCTYRMHHFDIAFTVEENEIEALRPDVMCNRRKCQYNNTSLGLKWRWSGLFGLFICWPVLCLLRWRLFVLNRKQLIREAPSLGGNKQFSSINDAIQKIFIRLADQHKSILDSFAR